MSWAFEARHALPEMEVDGTAPISDDPFPSFPLYTGGELHSTSMKISRSVAVKHDPLSIRKMQRKLTPRPWPRRARGHAAPGRRQPKDQDGPG